MRGNAHVRFGGRVGETGQAERLEPRPASTLRMIGRRRRDQRGQVLVMAVFVMAFLFVPLAIYVIDSGLVEAAHVQTGETLQAAAEDGAQSLDVAAFRDSEGQVVRLDPDQARATADSSLRASRLPGLESWKISVTGNTVTVTARVRVSLFALGAVTLTQSKGATFVVGT